MSQCLAFFGGGSQLVGVCGECLQPCMVSSLLAEPSFQPLFMEFLYLCIILFCSISSLLPLSSVCPNPSLTRQPLPLLSCYLNSFAFSSPLPEDLFLSSHGPTHKLTHPCKPRICKDRKCSHCIFAPGLFHVTQ